LPPVLLPSPPRAPLPPLFPYPTLFRSLGSLGFLSSATSAAAQASAASQYPTHPVKMIAPYSPGGTTDALARVIAHELSKKWNERSAEHTSELQSREKTVCRLLRENKKR